MTEKQQGDVITGVISDVKNSTAAIGKDITQTNIAAPPTAEELRELTAAFTTLRGQIERDAPADVRDEAVRQADALKEATLGSKPDVSLMAQARNWFLKHAPGLFGAVTTVIVNPIVGKVVQAAGDAVAAEYRKHFPEAQS